ncbi:8277_t:CDS:2 [Diversispora eburnea]|uniref:8277_t:CDS:1 n=1 Tax=Diversispora eburnea TaxID=1213867 RepID=A0A9N8VBQ2_9GLOM|nr:8277_t:CDS:2 [Diversispora eburnea]
MKSITITRKEPESKQTFRIAPDATSAVIEKELGSFFRVSNFHLMDTESNDVIFKTYGSFCDGKSYEICLNVSHTNSTLAKLVERGSENANEMQMINVHVA